MVLPISLFSQKLRRNTTWLFILPIFINIGACGSSASSSSFLLARTSSSRGSGRVPSDLGWDYNILLGSFAGSFMWFLLFIRQMPVMAIAEISGRSCRR
jgi:molybdopterin-containing oxidoreductase family membrane subunit